ncbi:MAG: hypothetical protein LBK83_05570 [Treponema sp.]|jgi:hypothetical protein|nr:hypothetical protein [Treponema sp.]
MKIRILDFPFFYLNYSNGVFIRALPPGAEDLGGGVFRNKGSLYSLPEGSAAGCLSGKEIKGKTLLALARRSPHPLVAKGPLMAPPGKRLMGLDLEIPAAGRRGSAGGESTLAIRVQREIVPRKDWLPLEDLSRYYLYHDEIYEIIDDETLDALAAEYGSGGKLILRGEEIPRFADEKIRLIVGFADRALKQKLSEDRLFIRAEELSLVLSVRAEPGKGCRTIRGIPALARGRDTDCRHYDAAEVSAACDRDYVLLDEKWARRKDLEKTGLNPLGRYAGGEVIEGVGIPVPLLFRRGEAPPYFSRLEYQGPPWLDRAEKAAIFCAHLDFLRFWGISGGVIHSGRGRAETASLLARWLQNTESAGKHVSSETHAGKTIVLMERNFWELYFSISAASLPPPFEGEDLLSSRNNGICTGFYESLPPSSNSLVSSCDMLILFEPEHAAEPKRSAGEGSFPAHAAGNYMERLGNIDAGVVLGISSEEPGEETLRRFFGLKGERAGLGRWIYRNTGAALPLPRFYRMPAGKILTSPFGGRFTADAKFRGIPAPELAEEGAFFYAEGTGDYDPEAAVKTKFTFGELSEEEKNSFFRWRHLFRKGIQKPAGRAFISIYARELCLAMGNTEPPEAFAELSRLQEYCVWLESFSGEKRDLQETAEQPRVSCQLLRRLFDFGIMYGITSRTLPLVLSRAAGSGDYLIQDLLIHKKYIEENNSIAFEDINPFIGDLLRGSSFYVFYGKELEKALEKVINRIDRRIRDLCKKRLFEFFFPVKTYRESRRAFADMEAAGYSSYTAEWAHFLGSKPLLKFTSSVFRYVEYMMKIKTGFEKPRQTPPLEEYWRLIADAALNDAAPPAHIRPGSVKLRHESIERLRSESDEVKQLLLIEENSAEGRKTDPVHAPPPPGVKRAEKKQPGIKTFIDGLNETERKVLFRIASAEDPSFLKTELKETAVAGFSMPELLIDGINEKFMDAFGDLLIENREEGPCIAEEYRERLRPRT